jgi:PTH1 family peptidyl-tRNA hydrolase
VIIAALGNPGEKYAGNRHNIAWQLIEQLSFYSDLEWEFKFNGDFSLYRPEGGDGSSHHILLPLTFMNLSGKSVAALMRFYKLSIEQLLVVHDEIELEFGTFGFKLGGGLAGHNGLRSITTHLGSRDFGRLRLGISRPATGEVTDYVLGDFDEDEKALLSTFLESAARVLEENLARPLADLASEFKKVRTLPPG